MPLDDKIRKASGLDRKKEIFWDSENGIYTFGNKRVVQVRPIGNPLTIETTQAYTKKDMGHSVYLGERAHEKSLIDKIAVTIVGKDESSFEKADYFCVGRTIERNISFQHKYGEVNNRVTTTPVVLLKRN